MMFPYKLNIAKKKNFHIIISPESSIEFYILKSLRYYILKTLYLFNIYHKSRKMKESQFLFILDIIF